MLRLESVGGWVESMSVLVMQMGLMVSETLLLSKMLLDAVMGGALGMRTQMTFCCC